MQIYCLINCHLGKEDEVFEYLKKLSQLGSISRLQNSAYDIIAKFLANSEDEMRELVTWKVRKHSGVKSMQTLQCLREKVLV